MEKIVYTVRCKKCKHEMKCMPLKKADKFIKKCVYCGFSNTVKMRQW